MSDGQPAWAPNGRTLLFSNGSNIKWLDPANGRARTLARNVQEFGASWSPDGTRFAYTHGFASGPLDFPATTGTTTVYVADANGADSRHLLGHDVNGGTPAWSPTGRRIAVVGYQGIYIVNADGSGLHRIVKKEFDTPGTPTWSPDGRWIAFIGGNELDVVKRDGTGLKTLSRCDCDTQTDSASWSPTGSEIAYSAKHGLFIIDGNGTHRHRLVRY